MSRDEHRVGFLLAIFLAVFVVLAASPSAAQEGPAVVDVSIEDRAGVLSADEETDLQSALERLASEKGRWVYAFLFTEAPEGRGASERERFFDEAGVLTVPEGAVLLGVVADEDRAHVSAPDLSSAEAEAVATSMEADFRRGDFAEGLLGGIEELEGRLSKGGGTLPEPPPKYEVLEDGSYIFEGDVVGDCRSLLEEARKAGTENSAAVRGAVEACTEAGFPPRGTSLPGTGGPLLLPAVGVLLLGASCAAVFLGVRRLRRVP